MNFADRLIGEIIRKKTPLVVGLDPRLEHLPAILKQQHALNLARGKNVQESAAICYELFCIGVIDSVYPHVPAIKPQMAFFEEQGQAGMQVLSRVIDYAQKKELLVILDGKRNDIGSTAAAYAAAYVGRKPASAWGADALTVNPWMGYDTLVPFVAAAHANAAGLFVLVKTSNHGSRDLQDQQAQGQSLYLQVGLKVDSLSKATLGKSNYGVIGAVVGATYPEQLAELRRQMTHTIFLIPGFGAQGGTAADVAAGFDANGLGAIVNSARDIIFAFENKEFAFANELEWQRSVEKATVAAAAQLAADTPAGKLRI